MGCGASNTAKKEEKPAAQQQQQQPAPAEAPPPAEEVQTRGLKAARLPSRTAAKKADWDSIKAKLPTSRSAGDFDRRTELFRQFDPNGNGYLSLAEVDKGVRDILQVEEIFDCKPVIMRAFQAARQARKNSGKPQRADDYVERTEFRMLLVYLKRYFEIWQMFDETDSSDDRRITLDEFKRAVPKLEEWGVHIGDPEATFKEIDANKGGFLLFDEFSSWVLDRQLTKEVDDDAVVVEPAAPAQQSRGVTKGAKPPSRAALASRGTDWGAIKAKLPTDRSQAAFDQRQSLFRQFDPNGNGYLSLAEVDKGIKDILVIEEIFDCKPVIMRAFQAAKGTRKAVGKGHPNDDYVEKSEFRLLLVYLKQYFHIWEIFDDVDGTDDRRITVDELDRAMPEIHKLGIKSNNAQTVFDEIDTNKGGFILFDEFSAWCITKHLMDNDDDA